VLQQAAGSRNPHGGIRVVKAFLQERQDGHGDPAERLGRKQSRLWLLVLEEGLQHPQNLLIGCGAEGLGRGSPNRRVGVSCQIGCDEHRCVVAESQ
jgi:hypothetical protein